MTGMAKTTNARPMVMIFVNDQGKQKIFPQAHIYCASNEILSRPLKLNEIPLWTGP